MCGYLRGNSLIGRCLCLASSGGRGLGRCAFPFFFPDETVYALVVAVVLPGRAMRCIPFLYFQSILGKRNTKCKSTTRSISTRMKKAVVRLLKSPRKREKELMRAHCSAAKTRDTAYKLSFLFHFFPVVTKRPPPAAVLKTNGQASVAVASTRRERRLIPHPRDEFCTSTVLK